MAISAVNVHLSLGSNLGDRLKFLREAIGQINQKLGDVGHVSPIYETPSWGFVSNDRFLNLCLSVKTRLSPESVLKTLKVIEKQIGRKEKNESGYSSREIDIDIILFGNRIVKGRKLEIPHPRYAARRFVLQPLNDIATECIDPMTHLSIGQLFANCPDTSEITYYAKGF